MRSAECQLRNFSKECGMRSVNCEMIKKVMSFRTSRGVESCAGARRKLIKQAKSLCKVKSERNLEREMSITEFF